MDEENKEEKSVGAIVVNERNEYLLLCRADKGDNLWEFPKGHQLSNETDEMTMRRELEEECGITDFVLIDGFKENNRYVNSRGVRRLIVMYMIRVRNPAIRLSSEHKAYEWLDYGSAVKRLNHHNWLGVIAKAEALLSSQSKQSA